ncbi:hypothetical protein [Nonomuraea bangladeshensis]|uniref:hypothetical protein n=1 Tax=Nonomuraea bangladeshensis TaxID=404385 RepID=UPI0031D0CB0B
MSKKMTGPEHAQAALDHLAEARALVALAEKATSREWKETHSQQAAVRAQLASAEMRTAQLAFLVATTSTDGLDPREAKEWRNILGVSL